MTIYLQVNCVQELSFLLLPAVFKFLFKLVELIIYKQLF